MSSTLRHNRLVWLGAGLVLGLILGGVLPDTPLHTVATDRTETFAMATAPVDQDIEAVVFLDFLTGDLRAVVLGKMGNQFQAFYNYNVLQDLQVNPSQNPKFMMVTGIADLRRGAARMQPSSSVIYVAEVTSGKVAAYAIPWSSSAHAANQVLPPQPLVRLGVTQFRAPAAGAGAGPGM